MLSQEVYSSILVVAENQNSIKDYIALIYHQYQILKLQKFGYTWGYNSTSNTKTVYGVFDFCYDTNFVYINGNRGCGLQFPISWLGDEQWKNEAEISIEYEYNNLLIHKLSS